MSEGPLRVALVTETFPPEVNGVAMTLGRMVEGLVDLGHAVHLVRPRQRHDEVPRRGTGLYETLVPGIPIPRYDGLRFGLPARALLVSQWHDERPDIVHVATEGPLGWSAVSAARALRLPVTSGFHTNFHAYSRHYGLGWLDGLVGRYLRKLHNRTDATLVPTENMARRLASEGYCSLAVVSRGVDTTLFNPRRRSKVLRASWGVREDGLAVCHVGRLAPEKNLDLVLRAFDSIRRVRPNARLIFVGDGPSRKALARNHPEHVFAGIRRGEELATHYASADLFLFPSLTETYGNVTAEALASGLGVVAYDCAAAAELIEENRNGCLVPTGDAEAFMKKARLLAASPDKLLRLRGEAVLSVSHLGWNQVHDCLVRTLRERIAHHKRRCLSEDGLLAILD